VPEGHLRIYLKNELQAKRAGGMDQMVQYLLDKCKDPEFYPQYCQKKERCFLGLHARSMSESLVGWRRWEFMF
jgi:hypothetical protein